jgi:hypothetical protein
MNQTYGQIADLVSDATSAGVVCDKWLKPLRERLSADSRYCKKSLVEGAIYTSDLNKQKAIKESIQFAMLDRKYNMAPESILVGPNWTVTGPLKLLQKIEPHLGGVVQDNTCAVVNGNGDGC